MVRRLVKTGLACGLRWSGVSAANRALRGPGRAPWIVSYHRVVEDFAASAASAIEPMLIDRAMFVRHLDWITARFECVSLDDLGDRLERGAGFRRPAAAITFDDGYSDVYHHAFPILKARGIPAAVFVISALVGTTRPPLFARLHHRLLDVRRTWPARADLLASVLSRLGPESAGLVRRDRPAPDPHDVMRLLLEQLPQPEIERAIEVLAGDAGFEAAAEDGAEDGRLPMTWEMLAEMRRAGVTIASHSRTHPLLSRENPDTVRDEIAGSRRDLMQRLGADVLHFAYPNGWFNSDTVEAVAQAGYRWAYTSCRHRDPAYPSLTLPRTLLWQNSATAAFGAFSPAVMGCQADGLFERLSGCPVNHWN
ncbi:MAG TPA: polysaccharide deacetylase family protein [Patescibacteria group bacterium]|nr:polysaccharide deacetylase family protein [Patescibacteria group bacterium]